MSAALKALEKLEFFLIAALMLCMVALYATGIAVREARPPPGRVTSPSSMKRRAT